MNLISLINSSRNQVFKFKVGNYSASVLLKYKDQQRGWFISFEYSTFSINNLRITTSGNFLHKFRNLIPFGLSCVVEGDQEPMLKDDFLSGRAKLYILTSDEVAQYNEAINGQTSA